MHTSAIFGLLSALVFACVAPQKALVVDVVVPSFGPGFLDLSQGISSTFPYQLPAASNDTNNDTTVVFGREAVFVGTSQGSLAYRFQAGRLEIDSTAMPPGKIMAAVDIDGDDKEDMVMAEEGQVSIWWAWDSSSAFAPTVFPLSGAWSIHFDDLDHDGLLDVIIGLRMGRDQCGMAEGKGSTRIFLNHGNREFIDRTDILSVRWCNASYAVWSGRIGNDDMIALMAGGPEPSGSSPDPAYPSLYRRETLDGEGYPHYGPAAEPVLPSYALPATGKEYLAEIRQFCASATDPQCAHTDDAFLSHYNSISQEPRSLASASAMGMVLGDLDGDGLDDVIIASNPEHVVLLGTNTPGKWRDATRDTGLPVDQFLGHIGHAMIPWGMALLDLDGDGKLDIVSSNGNDGEEWNKGDSLSAAGPQHAEAHWNAGNLRFVDVSEKLGLRRMGQWKALAVGDIDGDGRPDLGVGSEGPLPGIYWNQIESGGNAGLSLRLRGTTSNPLAMGARVVVQAQNLPPQARTAGNMASPWVFSGPVVFASTGKAVQSDLSITWPSGFIQEAQGIEAGKLREIVEPEIIRIEPVARHVQADGRSVARLVVTPRKPDGSVDSTASIGVKISHGLGCTVAIKPGATSAGLIAEIQSPVIEGSSVIEVSINGTPLQVRPRIWWDTVR